MKHKPIRIDWEELESAFESKHEDFVYYLDLVTGHVVLEGEGEEEDDEVDLAAEGGADAAALRDETTRLYVEPPDPADEKTWMEEFVAESVDSDPAVLDRLRKALTGDDPAAAFREVLRGEAELRESWFLYRSERVHEIIEAWLDANGVRFSEPAPWHS